MTEPGALPEDRARLNLRRLCEELGADFRIASGEARSIDKYHVLTASDYQAGSLSAIAIRRWGRFGNNLRQILHATFLAGVVGVRRIHVNEVNVGRLRAPET